MNGSTGIISCVGKDRSPAPNQNQKEILYQAYEKGIKRKDEDFKKLVYDIIDKATEIYNEKHFYKTETTDDLINTLNTINYKTKKVGNMINYSLENDINRANDEALYQYFNNQLQSMQVNEKEESAENTQMYKIKKWDIDDNLDNNKTIVVDKKNAIDDVKLDNLNKTTEELKDDQIKECSVNDTTESLDLKNSDNMTRTTNNTKQEKKKKKKEPTFFLYDTTKKKKDNTNNSNNQTNNKVTNPNIKRNSTDGNKLIGNNKLKITNTEENKTDNSKATSLSKKNMIKEIARTQNTYNNNQEINHSPRINYQTTPVIRNNYYIFNQSNYPITPMTIHTNNPRSLIPHGMNFNTYSNDFLTFIYKLHNDILTFHKNVTNILENLKEIKIYTIKYIEKLIKDLITDVNSLDIYGSFASDLSIESSDIDMKIKLNQNDDPRSESSQSFDLEQIILLIVKSFNSYNIFESVIPIYTASVPIIKIMVNPIKIVDDDNLLRLEEFKNSELYRNYLFNRDEIEMIKIDLTFLDIVNTKKHSFANSVNNINMSNPMSSVEYAKNSLILYPEIKPIIQVMKRYLQTKKMNSCFNGKHR